MENVKCVLFTEDHQYGEHMVRCLRKTGAVNMSTCDKVEDLKDYEYIFIDINNIDESQKKEFLNFDKTNKVITEIVENIEKNVVDNSGEKAKERDGFGIDNIIWKYDPLSIWVSKAIKIYTKKNRGIPLKPVYFNKTKVISVLSCGGGMGSTSCAMAIASDYAYCGGKNVLYMSLTNQCQELYFKEKCCENDLRKFLYKRHMEGAKTYIEEYLQKNSYGVNTFRISNLNNPLKYMKNEHIEEFFQQLVNEEDFEIIIFDIGNEMWDISKIALAISDIKVVIDRNEKTNFDKEFLASCNMDEKNDILIENFAYAGNKKFDEFFEDDEENKNSGNIYRKVRIVKDTAAFKNIDGIREIDLNSSFGISIREVINMI